MNAFLKKKNLRLPLPKSNRGINNLWKNIAISMVLLVLLIGLLNFFQAPIKNTFYYATSPFLKMADATSNNGSNFFNGLFNGKELTQENNNLKEENQNLLSKIILLQNTVKADQAIKEVLQNTEKDNVTLVLAQTISLDATHDFLLINKGLQDGILENMPVISSTKVLYGKVFKVYKNFAQVMLISDSNSVVDSKIQQDDLTKPPIYGAIKGSGNLSLYLDLIAQDAKIQTDDVVITSGLEGIFPKNLLIGKITLVNKNDAKPFQTAKVQSLFDIKNINNLFIITNYLK